MNTDQSCPVAVKYAAAWWADPATPAPAELAAVRRQCENFAEYETRRRPGNEKTRRPATGATKKKK